MFGFTGHGHKRTYVGQQSPLIVGYTWTAAGEAPVPHSTGVFPGTGPEFDMGPYRFVLLDHTYDQRMRLLVFTRD